MFTTFQRKLKLKKLTKQSSTVVAINVLDIANLQI